MSRRIVTAEGRIVELDQGILWVGDGLYAVDEYKYAIELTPAEAVTLASALLQYATQNGASREQAD